MKKNSNSYILIYSAVMIAVVALLLAYASLSLKDRQNANIRIEKQGAILSSIGLGGKGGGAGETERLFAKYIIDSYAVDGSGNRIEGVDAFGLLDNLKEEFSLPVAERRLPVFAARLDDGTLLNVLPLYGSGLWGPIWGYVALEEDRNTIYGVSFDHKGETPGLGAEIAAQGFSGQFAGKQIFRDGDFYGIAVLKGSGASAGNPNAVDAVSGGTITSRGVESMIRSCMEAYMPLIELRIEN